MVDHPREAAVQEYGDQVVKVEVYYDPDFNADEEEDEERTLSPVSFYAYEEVMIHRTIRGDDRAVCLRPLPPSGSFDQFVLVIAAL